MQTIKINSIEISQRQISLIADYLKRGLVIAYPTDTVYGLGCLASDKKAILKIKKIKGLNKGKALLMLVNSVKMAKKYCYVSKGQEEYLKKVWPGSVTVILKSKGKLPEELSGGLDNLAARLPKNDFLIKIISQAGFPLMSTSLNKQGERPLRGVKNLAEYFKYLPDLAIDAGECENTKPSRLVDIRDVEKIKVLRK